MELLRKKNINQNNYIFGLQQNLFFPELMPMHAEIFLQNCRMITTLESATFMDGFRMGQNVLIIAQKITDSDMFGHCFHLILMREAPKIQSNFFCGKWPKSKILGFGLKDFYHRNNMAETGCCECQTAGCSQFFLLLTLPVCPHSQTHFKGRSNSSGGMHHNSSSIQICRQTSPKVVWTT